MRPRPLGLLLTECIVIMAGLKLAGSCVVLGMFELAKTARNKLATDLAMHQEEYENNCTGDSPIIPEYNCQQLEDQIIFLQNLLSSDEHAPAIGYVNEYLMYIGLFVGLAGGIAGLWAGYGCNTLAAKLFLWSWLAALALSITSLAVSFARGQTGSYGITGAFVSNAVAWSYYAVLKVRDINTSPGVDSGVELRDIMNEYERNGATA